MYLHALGQRYMIGERGFAAAQCPSILPEVSGYLTGGVTTFLPSPLPPYIESIGTKLYHLGLLFAMWSFIACGIESR